MLETFCHGRLCMDIELLGNVNKVQHVQDVNLSLQ